MKIAHYCDTQYSAVAAFKTAKAKAISMDRIRGVEYYDKYTFADNSALIFSCSGRYALDADDAESIKGYSAWLGEDAWREADEIERLLEAFG